MRLDSKEKYQIELSVLNDKMLRLSYLKDNKVFRERFIKAKLKDDGYLYLQNNNVRSWLIPFLFGAIDVKKIRLAKTKENDLISDASNFRSGAVFLVMFLDYKIQNYRNVYPRLSN